MLYRSIQRFEAIVFSRDGERLLGALSDPMVTGMRVWQEGDSVIEVHEGHWTGGDGADLRRKLAAAGLDVDSVFDVEVFRKDLYPGEGSRPVFYRPVVTPREMNRVVDFRDLYRGPGGTPVFLCLNGPSFDEKTRVLLTNRPGVMTFGVNNGGHVFRPHLWTCVDSPERFMRSIWVDGRIQKFVPVDYFDRSVERMDGKGGWPAEKAYREPVSVRDSPWLLGYKRNEAFNAATFLTEPSFNWGNHKSRGGGRSVMLVALKIAYVLGFRRVVLVGCDFEMSAKKRYWFPEQRSKQAIRNNMATYEILVGIFTELRPVFEAAGFSVVNATPDSRLTVFPSVDLEAEVAASMACLSGSTDGMY